MNACHQHKNTARLITIMGCSQGLQVGVRQVDPRQPFSTMSDIDDLRQFWGFVKRKFEATAVENMVRFFRRYPYVIVMFRDLPELRTESDMRRNPFFEAHALSVLGVFDYAIEHIEDDVDNILLKLEQVAKLHAKIDGFQSDFFQLMEECLIEAIKDKFWEAFTSHEEDLFRTLFKWIEENMRIEVEAIEYRLIPGD